MIFIEITRYVAAAHSSGLLRSLGTHLTSTLYRSLAGSDRTHARDCRKNLGTLAPPSTTGARGHPHALCVLTSTVNPPLGREVVVIKIRPDDGTLLHGREFLHFSNSTSA